MKILFALATAAMTISAPASAQDAVGDWVGVLVVNESARLPLVLHIKRDDAGALTGTMDSPAQGAIGLPLAEIEASDGRLTFKVPVVNGDYAGTWDADSKSWKGDWGQGGGRLPLDFSTRPPPQPLPADWQVPGDDEIRALIAERNAPRAGQGIVVGVLDQGAERIVAGGTGAGAGLNGTTLFEIGSISKVFTALILADMVNKGEVSLDDPAAKYLPAGHHMPQRGGRAITLRDLSTHRSGLPRMADDVGAIDGPNGPFADYGEAKLLAFLDRYQLTRDVGSQWEYSNLGVGLLGYLLGRAAGTDYETLLRERVTGPLGMNDTLVTLSATQAARLAPAFDTYMRPTPPWELSVHVGAGGIRSTAADMLKFARATLDPASPIAAAVKTALAVRVPGGGTRNEQALGWVVMHPEPDREILLHDGGTGGFRSLIAIEPAKARAVVTLMNSAAEPSAADLGLRVLMGSPMGPTPPVPPPPPPRVERTEVTLPAAELERVVGRYRFPAGFVVAVALENGVLRARNEAANAPSNAIFPEAPLSFFWKIVDAQIRFTTDGAGKVTGAELTQSGQTFTGQRLDP